MTLQWLGFIMVVALALTLPLVAIVVLCRNLFGFGVPLEAIRYPKIRPGPDLGFIWSDEEPDSPVWQARYPHSIEVRPGEIEKEVDEWLEPYLAKCTKALCRPILRVHYKRWINRYSETAEKCRFPLFKKHFLHKGRSHPSALYNFSKTLSALKLAQNRTNEDERLTFSRWSHLNRDPREPNFFRLIVISPHPLVEMRKTRCQEVLENFRDEDSPPYDENNAPERAVLVAGSDEFRRRLQQYAGDHIVDLYEERSFEKIKGDLPGPSPDSETPRPLVIVHNLELLLRDQKKRLEALRLLEDLVRLQNKHRGNKGSAERRHFRLLLLADISPLDRFLQSTELREAEEEAGRTVDIDDPAENVRWSRLLEDFTTFTGRAEPRRYTEEYKWEPNDPAASPGVAYLLKELAYVPDRVVEALLPDHDGVLLENEIKEWAGHFLADARKPAIADFLSSQLIEHYHYLWSISSRAEQILIHRIAAGEIPNVSVAYSLRSLVRRGIVVFDPAPRLMNDSFTRFVRCVERPELLRIWMRAAPQGAWSRIHGQLTIVLPIVLLLGGTIFVSGIVAIEAMIPVAIASFPALVSSLISGRRQPTA